MNTRKVEAIDLEKIKVAVVHDWLVGYFGAERVLEQILNIFPQADIFTLVDFLPDKRRAFLKGKKTRTSFIQKMPFASCKYRSYLPLMPLAIEQFDLTAYDLVISSNYAVAKGVITGPDQLHICYCHSPIRYAWDLMHQYLDETGLTRGIKSWLARIILHRMRIWDFRTSAGVDEFISNSHYIARRITKIYRRNSTVIFPPVDIDKFTVSGDKEDYYLTASRLVPYKRIGVIVDAFRNLPDKKLLVIGDGPEYKKIKAMAGPNVKMLGYQDTESLHRYMQRAKAFVFAACEDFGIAPVEAQACGIPVIAYGRGGALETVIDGKTGMFFEEQSPEAIADAITGFEQSRDQFDPMVIRANAQRFSIDRFKTEISKLVLQKIQEYFKAPPSGPTRKLHLRNRRGTKSRIPGEEILKNL